MLPLKRCVHQSHAYQAGPVTPPVTWTPLEVLRLRTLNVTGSTAFIWAAGRNTSKSVYTTVSRYEITKKTWQCPLFFIMRKPLLQAPTVPVEAEVASLLIILRLCLACPKPVTGCRTKYTKDSELCLCWLGLGILVKSLMSPSLKAAHCSALFSVQPHRVASCLDSNVQGLKAWMSNIVQIEVQGRSGEHTATTINYFTGGTKVHT